MNTPKIEEMKLVALRPHRQYGSAIFVRTSLEINSVQITEENDVELLTIELCNCTVTSVYKPPNAIFKFEKSLNLRAQPANFIIGDFNSHHTSWGYDVTDDNGQRVELWAESTGVTLIHDPKLPPSFNSGRWRKGYNPDIIFASDTVASQCVKEVWRPIPHTQHRPIVCKIMALTKINEIPYLRRYNFKKADWNNFTKDLDSLTTDLEPTSENYGNFIYLVRLASRKNIPRGCRTHYIPGLTPELVDSLNRYTELYEANPFEENTIEAGEVLMKSLAQEKRTKWCDLLNSVDMKRSSKKAWNLIKRLDCDPKSKPIIPIVTPNQIAHHLLINGKCNKNKHNKKSPKPTVKRLINEENSVLGDTFLYEELEAAMKSLKNGKSAGLDNMYTEQIQHFGPAAKQWLLKLFNNVRSTLRLPKIWRKSKVVALLKPGKDPNLPSSYRPVSLLCHTYKLYERILLNRLCPVVDEKLISEQAGFRPGKSCTGQVLNLTQFIENGFEKKYITGVAFIDLSAAYDTINHRILLMKIYNLTNDFKFTQIIESLLSNRRFFVTLAGKQSRWRNTKNGLPQGSVLAPTLFNIYTNDQPISTDNNVKHFIYADDSAVAVQGNQFGIIEKKLTKTLETMSKYYNDNYLKPNPSKTLVSAFHLKNKEANRNLQVIWEGVILTHCKTPTYLGVTLDRTLTYKLHCDKTAKKINTRNCLIRKLTGSTWGAQPHAIRVSALALCFSVREYACPAWGRSTHTKKVDTALNNSCRIITGCLKNTPVEKIYLLAGVAPPYIRRRIATNLEKCKQINDKRHPMFGSDMPIFRLKSRKSFLKVSETLTEDPSLSRITMWKDQIAGISWGIEPVEQLPPGHQLEWQTWRTLNRMRVGVGRSKENMLKWGYLSDLDTKCRCGKVQTMTHILVCPMNPNICTVDDLMQANQRAVDVARFWATEGI